MWSRGLSSVAGYLLDSGLIPTGAVLLELELSAGNQELPCKHGFSVSPKTLNFLTSANPLKLLSSLV